MSTPLMVAIAAALFFALYRLWMNPKRVLRGLTGWSAVLFCVIAIPAACFGVIQFMSGLHLPAVAIFVGLCMLWLLLVPA